MPKPHAPYSAELRRRILALIRAGRNTGGSVALVDAGRIWSLQAVVNSRGRDTMSRRAAGPITLNPTTLSGTRASTGSSHVVEPAAYDRIETRKTVAPA